MAKTKYGRQFLPEMYYEGNDLKIAQSIYVGDTSLVYQIPASEVNKINEKGMCFILYSIYSHNEQAMEILLEKGADSNIYCEVRPKIEDFQEDITPLSIAARRPQISFIKTLLKYGADINDNRAAPALLNAVHRNDREMVDFLLDNGADVNIQSSVTKDNALLSASNINDYDMVNHLLDRGANPMLRDVDGDCLAYSVQFDINKGRGTDKFKNTLQTLKKRLEGMGVVFPVEMIPPKEEEEKEIPASSKNDIREEVKTDAATSSTGTEQTDNLPQQNRKRTWSTLFDDDDA